MVMQNGLRGEANGRHTCILHPTRAVERRHLTGCNWIGQLRATSAANR